MKRKFFNCECGCEGVMIDGTFADDLDGSIYMSFWSVGKESAMSWSERVRWCLNVLKTGLPWTDQVVLSKDEARAIGEYLLEVSEKVVEESIEDKGYYIDRPTEDGLPAFKISGGRLSEFVTAGTAIMDDKGTVAAVFRDVRIVPALKKLLESETEE